MKDLNKERERNKDDPKKLEETEKKIKKYIDDSDFKLVSFEISNHYEVYYNKNNKDDLEGKKKYSNFIKSLLLKFLDIAEGLYDDMTLE